MKYYFGVDDQGNLNTFDSDNEVNKYAENKVLRRYNKDGSEQTAKIVEVVFHTMGMWVGYPKQILIRLTYEKNAIATFDKKKRQVTQSVVL